MFNDIEAGMDYESAREATPRWYGVSFGDGSNGVSHMYPDYYVRTASPWELARLAMLHSFKPEWHEAADNAMDLDGDAEYGISATIYDLADVDPSDGLDREWTCGECGHEWTTDASQGQADQCPECEGEEIEETETEDWASVNGAWSICEVFPIDSPPACTRLAYGSLDECFG